ncbi:DUF397 domain-containing protein [Streptomyces sp. UNOC14_S4]|nr:DUF397 domain-containing protein [Streptomyces sp. UNOC14_S4]
MSEITWQKSSFSGDRDECVEAAGLNGNILIRESDDPAIVVTTSRAKWRALTHAVKAGRLNHLI